MMSEVERYRDLEDQIEDETNHHTQTTQARANRGDADLGDMRTEYHAEYSNHAERREGCVFSKRGVS